MKIFLMRSSAGSAWENNMSYLDSHAHIFSEEFHDDFDAVLERAEKADVERIMIITLKEEEAKKAIAFARKGPEHYQVATGIFVDEADTYTDDDFERFKAMASRPEVTAVGEIGLDYHWYKDEENHNRQKELFIRQIEFARQINKPILVHSRDAAQDTFDILKEHHVHGLIHCFSGTKEMAKEYTKLGYYIALGGAVTFKNSRHAKEVASTIDAKYLLSETDCPYMAPEPVRGTRNEPCNIPYIVKVLAECRNIPVEEMEQIIDDNYTRFLKENA